MESTNQSSDAEIQFCKNDGNVSVFYKVQFTDCLPKTFEVKQDQNINDLINTHIKSQNRGVPKSERIYLEKITRL